ncbi:MAG: M23 family metallopeptidase [Candidatus Latescibacteria bacterium]|nr:M23 family metallopeptidase [Candidatus Latescibacterota bacterium]
MAKRRQKQLSILVIPDDGSRTLEFKLNYVLLGLLGCGLTCLLLLVCAGGVFLWQAQYWENKAVVLQRDNARLKTEMARFDELVQVVTRMKAWDQQLRSILSPNIDLGPTSYSVPVSTPLVVEDQVTMVRGRLVGRAQIDIRRTPSVWPISQAIGWVSRAYLSQQGMFRNQHLGMDIVSPEGTPVQATADGRVMVAGHDDILGLMVVIDHGDGYTTRYGHNGALLVSEGESVRRGQHIARVGNSGHSSGPHLHYEVLENGRARDPREFLPR